MSIIKVGEWDVMSITIGSNIASANAQRHMSRSTISLSESLERLSSGQRINRASDDAAGLAIADTLNSKTRIAAQAIRNVNDGISLLEITSQAVSSQKDILIRMSELAEQGGNGVYTYQQRKSIQVEYSALMQEYVRIAETTEFNGIRPLDGAQQSITIQSGLNGATTGSISVAVSDTSTTGGEEWMHYSLDNMALITGADTAAFNNFLQGTSSQLGPRTIENLYQVLGGGILQQSVTDSNGRVRDVYIVMNPRSDAAALLPNTSTGISIIEADADGNFIFHQNLASATYGTQHTRAVTFTGGATGSVTIDFTGMNFAVSTPGIPNATFGAIPDYAQTRRTSLRFTGVLGSSQARTSLDVINNKLNDLALESSRIGASQSRLSTAVQGIAVSRENFASARSRILDADIAEESAKLTRFSILQQVGSSVLAQANQQPSLAISLLSYN